MRLGQILHVQEIREHRDRATRRDLLHLELEVDRPHPVLKRCIAYGRVLGDDIRLRIDHVGGLRAPGLLPRSRECRLGDSELHLSYVNSLSGRRGERDCQVGVGLDDREQGIIHAALSLDHGPCRLGILRRGEPKLCGFLLSRLGIRQHLLRPADHVPRREAGEFQFAGSCRFRLRGLDNSLRRGDRTGKRVLVLHRVLGEVRLGVVEYLEG